MAAAPPPADGGDTRRPKTAPVAASLLSLDDDDDDLTEAERAALAVALPFGAPPSRTLTPSQSASAAGTSRSDSQLSRQGGASPCTGFGAGGLRPQTVPLGAAAAGDGTGKPESLAQSLARKAGARREGRRPGSETPEFLPPPPIQELP